MHEGIQVQTLRHYGRGQTMNATCPLVYWRTQHDLGLELERFRAEKTPVRSRRLLLNPNALCEALSLTTGIYSQNAS